MGPDTYPHNQRGVHDPEQVISIPVSHFSPKLLKALSKGHLVFAEMGNWDYYSHSSDRKGKVSKG